MAFRRNLFTGKLEEFEARGKIVVRADGTEEVNPTKLASTAVTDSLGTNAWNTPWRSKAMGVSDPSQIPEFNEAMRHQGVGAYIDPRTNELVCETRGQRARALKFFNKIDFDGGYGDTTEHSRPVA